MCEPTSEVSFTLSDPAREIEAGDPGAGFFEKDPSAPDYPRLVVTSAIFYIGGKKYDLKDWFAMGPIVPDPPTCATSVLMVVTGLAKLCEASAVGALTIDWQPAHAGTAFPLTARFTQGVG